MVDNVKELKTLEDIRIYSDPYRLQILDTFKQLNRPATMKEVADKMGEVPAKVYYHAKKLESIGLLQLVDTKIINGITAKYYEPYEGAIQIKKSYFDDSMRQVALTETEKLLSNLYDESKKRFLKASRSQTSSGQLTTDHVYLTPQEAKEFQDWVTAFLKQHQTKTSEESTMYEIFLTVSKSIDSED
ncbi:hypothetical protein POTG_03757 [Paenibacillus sp. oral taxon 786 str. D14]|nr:hypothetical protein POTG_03757 [Paenibacillus sp. oral taxon 786 str. D14]